MPRHVYFGERVNLSRTVPPVVDPPVPQEPQRLIPAMRIPDPNAEPLKVVAAIPAYGVESIPVREIHVVVVPAEQDVGNDAEALLAAVRSNPTAYATADVTNIFGEVELSVSGLGDGNFAAVTIIVAGDY